MSEEKKVSEELDEALTPEQIYARSIADQTGVDATLLEEAQSSSANLAQQMMAMQQQILSGGITDPEMILQMQQQAMDASGLAELFGTGDEDKENEQAIAEFIAAHPQPEGMSKYLALGSFFVIMRDEPLETLEMMGDVEDYVGEMVSSWGIEDRESLKEMLESLISGRHYHQTNDTYLAIKSGKLDVVADEDAEDYQSAVEALRELGLTLKEINSCPSVLAWDLERAAYLTRTGAHAEYITKEDAWAYLQRIGILAKEAFADWVQYGISIIMGRSMHMGYNNMYVYAMNDLLLADPEFMSERPLNSF